MNWKDISLRNKLCFGFGLMATLMLVIGILAYGGVGSVTQNAETVIQGNRLDGLLAQKEVDHLNWISKVNQLWTDPHARRIVDLYHDSEQEKAAALMNDFEAAREQLFEDLDELYLG